MTRATRKLTKAETLRLIQIIVYSVNDTLTPAEGLAAIGSFFTRDPIARVDPSRLAELLAAVDPPRPARRSTRKGVRAWP